MFQAKVKLEKELWQKIQRYAKAAGYATAEEFVQHILEKELAKLEEAESNEEIVKKLKGLGYLE